MTNLKPYPAYQDSGVPWLGELPRHWGTLPNRALLAEMNERNCPDEEMLSVTIKQGVIRQQTLLANNSRRDSSNQDKTTYKLVRAGDIVYNKMRAWQGAVGVSDYRGIVSPAYVVVRPHEDVDSRYFHYLLRTPAFAKEAERWSYGITSDQWSLRYEHFKMIYCSFPPPEEQTAIARFLDYIDRRIRRYIRSRRRLIELLNEQKQAIIQQAVIRGLDPDVPLKDSGVDWLGKVPEHWEITRNGRLFVQRNETGFPYLPVLEVSLRTGVRIRDLENGDRKQMMSDRSKYKRAVSGDIAYNMMRMWQGAVGAAPVDGLVSPAYVVARPLKGIDSRYFSSLFRTAAYMRETDRYSRGIVKDRNRLYWEDFKQMSSPCPPPAEQLLIADAIDERTRAMDDAISQTQREIDLVREYRTRMIADVVTGKLDVRRLAADLPDEADEPEESESVEDGGDWSEDGALEELEVDAANDEEQCCAA